LKELKLLGHNNSFCPVFLLETLAFKMQTSETGKAQTKSLQKPDKISEVKHLQTHCP